MTLIWQIFRRSGEGFEKADKYGFLELFEDRVFDASSPSNLVHIGALRKILGLVGRKGTT